MVQLINGKFLKSQLYFNNFGTLLELRMGHYDSSVFCHYLAEYSKSPDIDEVENGL
ncbi:MAG: hypothetical protein ACR5K7_04335 [Symbiopectobacterium sp.]